MALHDLPLLRGQSLAGEDVIGFVLEDYELSASTTVVVSAESEIGDCEIKLSETLFTYDGKGKTPIVTINGLTEDKDFTETFAEHALEPVQAKES